LQSWNELIAVVEHFMEVCTGVVRDRGKVINTRELDGLRIAAWDVCRFGCVENSASAKETQ